jgi:hypothetical protein
VTTQAWALAYAELGWRIFPVVAGEKRPMYRGWQRDATTDPDLIARFWRREPGPNIGIVTGESFVAFDVEGDHLPALRSWMTAHGCQLPDTPIARTGRGGIHVLSRAHARATAGHDLRLEGVHVGELKAAGGFIVACPSVTTGAYSWLRSPIDVEMSEGREWLWDLATQSAPAYAASCGRTIRIGERPMTPSRAVAMARGLYGVVAEATEGDRNKLLFWAACRAAEHNLEPSAITEILLDAATRAGLSEREARATIASGLAR